MLVYATAAGVQVSRSQAAAVLHRPLPFTWPHCEASAWTAAWLTVRGRGLLGPREIFVREEWHGELHWSERGETRERGHRPDLAGRLPDGRFLPIEVELTRKSSARLRAVLALHSSWVMSGHSAGLLYVCSDQKRADEVVRAGEKAGLSVGGGTLRVELLESIRREAIAARQGTSAGLWGASTLGVTA